MTGSSPGWASGYVPTAAEWNALWASKADYVQLVTLITLSPSSPSYGGDAEAALGGVPLGGFYLNGGFVMMRRT